MSERNLARRGFLGGIAAAQLLVTETRAEDVVSAKMKVAVGADHAGFPLKGPVVEMLRSWGHSVNDLGTYSTDPVDFPDIAKKSAPKSWPGARNAASWYAVPEWAHASPQTRCATYALRSAATHFVRTSAWNTITSCALYGSVDYRSKGSRGGSHRFPTRQVYQLRPGFPAPGAQAGRHGKALSSGGPTAGRPEPV